MHSLLWSVIGSVDIEKFNQHYKIIATEMKYKLIDASNEFLLETEDETARVEFLPEDSEFVVLADNVDTGFSRIRAILNGTAIVGLIPTEEITPATDENLEPESNLCGVNRPNTRNMAIRISQTWSRTYPLNDPNMPRRDGSNPVSDLGKIINYLKVESSKRFEPVRHGNTFCNIYAFDYAYLANAWLPRMWWTGRAIRKLRAGQTVVPKYGSTISEMSANKLYDWFEEYAEECGWREVETYDELQDGANQGEVGIIVAAHKVSSRSGHITAVVPETSSHKAQRDGSGKVTAPLQSQAGRVNRKYFSSNWEKGNSYRGFSYWLHK